MNVAAYLKAYQATVAGLPAWLERARLQRELYGAELEQFLLLRDRMLADATVTERGSFGDFDAQLLAHARAIKEVVGLDVAFFVADDEPAQRARFA